MDEPLIVFHGELWHICTLPQFTFYYWNLFQNYAQVTCSYCNINNNSVWMSGQNIHVKISDLQRLICILQMNPV